MLGLKLIHVSKKGPMADMTEVGHKSGSGITTVVWRFWKGFESNSITQHNECNKLPILGLKLILFTKETLGIILCRNG